MSLRPVATVACAAVIVAGCGARDGADHATPRPAPKTRPCAELVTALQRGRVPSTAADLRQTLRRLAAAGAALERVYGLADVGATVDALAAAARTRARAAEAIRDRRPTAARRLFVSARTVDLRAQMLARDLAERCHS